VFSWFWNSTSASYLWNNVAAALITRTDEDDRNKSRDEDRDDRHDARPRRHHTTLEQARLFAVLNLAIADAVIGCWDAKYTHVFWRPITAIPEAAADGNAATTADPTWAPLFATPAHPEYPSGHSCASGAAGAVLADAFGDKTRFTVESDTLPGITRSFRSFPMMGKCSGSRWLDMSWSRQYSGSVTEHGARAGGLVRAPWTLDS
jgi:hypothetical protein